MTKVFAAGQKFTIKGRGEWEVADRTRCYVTVRSGITTVRCKVRLDAENVESIQVPRSGIWGGKDCVSASGVIVPQETEISAYEVGNQVAALKGNPKAQQEVLQHCGEKFILAMSAIFEITLDREDALKCFCQQILRSARDGEYARVCAKHTRTDARNSKDPEMRAYYEGWLKFFNEHAAPEPEKTLEEQLQAVKMDISQIHYHRRLGRKLRKLNIDGADYGNHDAEYTERALELVKEYRALKAAIKQRDHKEAATMTKVTTEQAIEAIKAATTEDAIRDVLMTCTKLVMEEVHDAITGGYYCGPALKLKKAEFANWVTIQIMNYRKTEAFKALPYEDKYATVTNSPSRAEWHRKLALFTPAELEETCRRLELPSRLDESASATDDDKWLFVDDIIKELAIRKQVSELETLMSGDDVDDMKDELVHARPETLARLCKKYGLSVPAEQMFSALLEHYEAARAKKQPESVKFQLGHHYRENGATPQEIYTFIERAGDYGYFVDTFNVYYRRRIRELSGCEYANSPNTKGPNAASTLSADCEVPVHEIISTKHGNVSVILHAGQVQTPAELEEQLKEAARKKEQAPDQPAIEDSIVRAKDDAEIRAILGALTTDELKVYAARNLLTEKIPVNGDILPSLVRATKQALELFWEMRESDGEMGTPTTPLSKAFTKIHGATIPTCVAGDFVDVITDKDGDLVPCGGSDDDVGWECKKAWYRVHPEKLSFFSEIKGDTPEEARAHISRQDWTLSGLRFEAGLLGIGGETVKELIENMLSYAAERGIVKTQEEYLLEERKELQQELHKLWLMRRAVMRAQRMSDISREDYEALGTMWSDFGIPQEMKLLYRYHDINLALAQERCEYEEIPA